MGYKFNKRSKETLSYDFHVKRLTWFQKIRLGIFVCGCERQSQIEREIVIEIEKQRGLRKIGVIVCERTERGRTNQNMRNS